MSWPRGLPRLSREQIAYRQRLLAQGLSYREIGERCTPPISGEAVRSWAKAHGIDKAPAETALSGSCPPGSDQVTLRVRLLAQGLSYREIGERCTPPVSGAAVHAWARRHGIDKAPASDAPRTHHKGQRIAQRAYTRGIVLGQRWATVGEALSLTACRAARRAYQYARRNDLPWRYRSGNERLTPMDATTRQRLNDEIRAIVAELTD